MSFDDELWNRKLNDDIVKLNIYLTTTIGEFSIVLNILQMGLITKGFSGNKNAIADLTGKNNVVTQSSEYTRMLIGILLNDILKLRVDLSYCSRGNTRILNTTTKDEPICLNYQDFDGAGNQITTFRRNLHSMMITLVDRLNDPTAAYAEMSSLKQKITAALIKPYILLLKDAKLENTPEFKTRHFLKPEKVITESHTTMFDTKKQEELNKFSKMLTDDERKKILSGGEWKIPNIFKKKSQEEKDKEEADAKAKKESENRAKELEDQNKLAEKAAKEAEIAGKDDKILQYLISEPYATIVDEKLSTFLTDVYQFSKTESKTTEAETKVALESAKKAAELALDQSAAELSAQTMSATLTADAEAQKLQAQGATAGSTTDSNTVGGSRLTRKKRRANKKKVRQTKAVKKYNSVFMKGKFFKK
jgi:hypothetical protein